MGYQKTHSIFEFAICDCREMQKTFFSDVAKGVRWKISRTKTCIFIHDLSENFSDYLFCNRAFMDAIVHNVKRLVAMNAPSVPIGA